jgi:hypothetical protein
MPIDPTLQLIPIGEFYKTFPLTMGSIEIISRNQFAEELLSFYKLLLTLK